MSKIDELIAKLCPNGVEYKKLGEVGEFIRGSGLQKKILQTTIMDLEPYIMDRYIHTTVFILTRQNHL